MKLFLFFILLPLAAFAESEPELVRLGQKFFAERQRLSEVVLLNDDKTLPPMRFGFFAPSDNIGGNCSPQGVLISREEWAAQTETQREMLVFHELGHCLLNRPHREGTEVVAGKEIPKSLMADTSFPEQFYLGNRDYYLRELFFQ